MRSLKIAFGATALLLALAAPAAAHVSVQPSEAAKGGYAKLAFRVPNEEESASTIKLEVQLPSGAKFQSVSTRPLPGWTVATTDTTITWSGGKIEPGQFQEFEISVGPLPDVDQLVFKAVQTYDDGNVVRWIEPTPADGTEPEHPAPTLHLVAGTGTDDHDAAAATSTTVGADAGDAASTAEDGGDDGDDGKVLGAYAVALVALVLGGAALVQARRRPKP
jgi:uncharacterized protein YcnI